MTSFDILFWLLVILMGGVAWAVEAGLGQTHRNVLASSMFATLGSVVMMMYWVDDITKVEFSRHEDKPATAANGEEDPAQKEDGKVDMGGKKKAQQKGGGLAAPEDGGPAKSASSASSDGKDGAGTKRVGSGQDDTIEYSRAPFKDCPECPDMIIMSAGTTQTGSALGEPGRMPHEAEAKVVPVDKAFAIGRMEITRENYAAFVKATAYSSQTHCEMGKRRGAFNWQNPGFEQDHRHPVVCVTIKDVTVYLDWLSDKTGRMYQLPTETQWELAARSGTDTPYWTGDTLNRTNANFGRARDGTTPGGLFAMNRYGLSDVTGNAWEMTGDCQRDPKAPIAAPAVPAACRRLIKGGAWITSAADTRHAARAVHVDGAATNTVGFRVARAVDKRDDDKILTPAEKLALAKAEKDAVAISMSEEQAAEKAKLDGREAAFKANVEAKEKAKAKDKAKTDKK